MKFFGKRSIISEILGLNAFIMPCVLILLFVIIPWESKSIYGSAQDSITASGSIADYPYSTRHRPVSNYPPYYPPYTPYAAYHDDQVPYYGNETQFRSYKMKQKKTLKGIPVVLSGIVFLMLALYASGLTYKNFTKKEKLMESYKKHEANVLQGENLGQTTTAILSLIFGVISIFSGVQSIIVSIVPWAKSKLDEGDTQYLVFSLITFFLYHLVSKRMNINTDPAEKVNAF